MSYTAHKTKDQIKEHFDDPDILEEKCKKLAHLIKNAKHFIIFTGAGISTSAGIPDFRGPEGVWTLRAQNRVRTTKTVSTLKAMPTVTHMSILKLIQEGYCKYLISQNTDGLHRKSGVPPELLSELHGNSNLETCEKCKKEYLRDYRVRCAKKVHDHYTGRKCVCGGKLKDSIINFSESLPEIPMEKGFKHANKADLCLVLGSSLTVSPACEMPETVAKNGNNLVICNLQKTPYDSDACLRIFGKTDDVMKLVMQELGLDIPKWKLVRRVLIGHEKGRLYVRGIEPDGTPATIFKKVEIEKLTLQQEPFEVSDTVAKEGTDVKITLHFFGHYNEPSIKLKHKLKRHQYVLYKLEYDPFTRTWEIDLNEKK